MSWKDNFEAPLFVKLILSLWLGCSFIIFFLLGRIDYVVHHDLYYFNLQFSHAWADPYWLALRMIYVCVALPSSLSAIVIGADIGRKIYGARSDQTSGRGTKRAKNKKQRLKENSMLISCPSCKKTFGKPLVILDFSNGKARLVNVCPYCNARLGNGGKRDKTNDLEVGVLEPSSKTKTR